jgi:stage II sporulation protein D
MIVEEPKINVGIVERRLEVAGIFNGPFRINNKFTMDGAFRAYPESGQIILLDALGNEVLRQREVCGLPVNASTFTLFNVTIGIHFHWERNEEQTFLGALSIVLDKDHTLTAVNTIPLEDYLTSVISSEMNGEAPLEFLKAHAIMSRSWIAALLQRSHKQCLINEKTLSASPNDHEIIRWYDRVDHTSFDVCADDHCQRYQGIAQLISENARHAVHTTRGLFITHNNEICDARYHKACGGLTDRFESAWEDTSVPYLMPISDSHISYSPVCTDTDAEQWMTTRPEAYCNTHDEKILCRILPSYDRETSDFFRWKVVYTREQMEIIIRGKSGIDFGTIVNLVPIERGPSGRIIRLKIEGSKKTVIVGKELEIRRWLSPTHLYSSAFIVSFERDTCGHITQCTLRGAGWGHGIGLCQIGAAVMASNGFSADHILKHYFKGVEIKQLY